jgi:hypothetical protein
MIQLQNTLIMERQFHSVFTNVVNYINVPPYLYRYENKEYVDKFFETGEILISNFSTYKKYKDNQLGDATEGNTLNVGLSENDRSMGSVTSVGATAYSFCTSTNLDEAYFPIFSRNSAFRIKDPINFMREIERTLGRVTEAYYGNCIYLDKKIIQKNVPSFELNDLKDNIEPDKVSFDKLMSLMEPIYGPEQFFIKKMDYQAQNEYRFIWLTDRQVSEPKIIHCPEALKFCERI